VFDAFSLRMLLAAVVGWLDQRQQEAVAYVIQERTAVKESVGPYITANYGAGFAERLTTV
jgi:hypothetical protein